MSESTTSTERKVTAKAAGKGMTAAEMHDFLGLLMPDGRTIGTEGEVELRVRTGWQSSDGGQRITSVTAIIRTTA